MLHKPESGGLFSSLVAVLKCHHLQPDTQPARLATPRTPAVAVPTEVGPHPLQQPFETLLALLLDWLRQALRLALVKVCEEASAPAALSAVPRASLLNGGLVDTSDSSVVFD